MRTWILFFIGSVLLSAGAPRRAQACGNGVEEQSPQVGGTMAAENALEAGDAKGGLAGLKHGHFSDDITLGSSPITDRVLAVRTRLVARSAGKIGAFKAEAGAKESPEAQIDEARTIAEGLLRARPSDPRATSDLAEVLSLIPAERNRALALFQGLEARDVLPSAWGYAALIRLRTAPLPAAPGYVSGPLLAIGKAPAVMAHARCLAMTHYQHPKICRGYVLTLER